jgi:hypothetical protein
MRFFRAFRKWLNNEWLAWSAAWHEVWQERSDLELKRKERF